MDFNSPFLLFVLGTAASVMFELLRRKDAAQSKQIELLFTKHDEDAKRLQELELDIARRHYVKGELDTKFDRLDNTFKAGFDHLGAKFDQLSSALTAHITKEDVRS